ncbi:molybdate ABC transporter substrate-binding protein [Compostibacter hankyongensis]
MKRILILLLATGLTVSVTAQELRIAVAANAQFAARALVKAFREKTDAAATLIVSSSGKITAQVRQGAPFDLFLSADMQYPRMLSEEGYTLDTPRVYACGALVLWSLKERDISGGIGAAAGQDIARLAVANPKTAPYGVAALQAIRALRLYDRVKDKIVYGESISQVNQYLLSGAADLALTAKSVVMAPVMKGRGKWVEVDSRLYQPIDQGVVILRHAQGAGLEKAQAFYRFIFSPQGRAVFAAYGYVLPPLPPKGGER